MKKLLFLGTCLVALASSPVMAQTGGADVVMVRVTEYIRGDAQLIIERTGQASEEIKFDFWSKPAKGPSAAAGYLSALKKLYEQGYQLQGVIPGESVPIGAGGYTSSTLVFVRPVSK